VRDPLTGTTYDGETDDDVVSERFFEPDRAETDESPPPVKATQPEPRQESVHTWRPLDLVALGSDPPEPPTIGGLFYERRRHVVSGEFDTGKSFLMQAISASELRAGHGVVWVDDDDMGPNAVLERLRAFGLEDKLIAERFAYLRPAEPFSAAARTDVLALIRDRAVRLVVFDAFNATLSLNGFDPNSSREVEQFFRHVVRPLSAEGAAVVFPDHVVKHREARGRYSYGSERKQTGVEVHLGMTLIEAFGRGRTGRAKLVVHKDRVGFLERPSPGLFVLASDPETGRLSWRIEPDHAVSDEGAFRPTNLMEKVSRYLEVAGEPRSRNQIEQDVQGKSEYVRQAIDVLVLEDFAIEFQGERRARLVRLTRPFRESDEWAES
jgi:AAA domain